MTTCLSGWAEGPLVEFNDTSERVSKKVFHATLLSVFLDVKENSLAFGCKIAASVDKLRVDVVDGAHIESVGVGIPFDAFVTAAKSNDIVTAFSKRLLILPRLEFDNDDVSIAFFRAGDNVSSAP